MIFLSQEKTQQLPEQVQQELRYSTDYVYTPEGKVVAKQYAERAVCPAPTLDELVRLIEDSPHVPLDQEPREMMLQNVVDIIHWQYANTSARQCPQCGNTKWVIESTRTTRTPVHHFDESGKPVLLMAEYLESAEPDVKWDIICSHCGEILKC